MIINGKQYNDFVKRMGQWHLSHPFSSEGKTLCGRPMLGNNYAKVIPQEERENCQECFERAEGA